MRIIVRYQGRVQGVGFRATVRSLARPLPVTGFVRNEPDGSVYMEVQGERVSIAQLREAIRDRMARYIQSEVGTDAVDIAGESEFIIAR